MHNPANFVSKVDKLIDKCSSVFYVDWPTTTGAIVTTTWSATPSSTNATSNAASHAHGSTNTTW